MTRQRTPEQMKAIGQRLKMARESLGMTQRQVCEILDIRPATWNHWETGRRLPDPVVIAELADSHQLSLDWVYSGRPVVARSDPEQTLATGHRLQASRSVLELSPQEMAGLLGIRTETLETWESGRALPDIETMSVLAEKFGVSLDWLFRGDPSGLPYRLAKTLLKL